MSNNYWFKRKRYGWGWVPVTWQGTAVTLLYVLVLLAGVLMSKDRARSELGIFLLIVVLATVGFVRIALHTSPKPKWRWGKSRDDNPKEDF